MLASILVICTESQSPSIMSRVILGLRLVVHLPSASARATILDLDGNGGAPHMYVLNLTNVPFKGQDYTQHNKHTL